MSSMIRAAVIDSIGAGFTVQSIRIDSPVGREVLVEVKASGLCHSDLHMAENDFGYPMPAVFGHEYAGVVAAVGGLVSEFEIGDHVVGCLVTQCGHCDRCRVARPWQCRFPNEVQRAAGLAPRLSRDGEAIAQYSGMSGFAEQTIAHENMLVKVTKQIPFEKAALLSCGVVTGAGAAINTAGVRVGDTVAVIGCGGVGLNAIQGAVLAGARRVIAIDLQPAKLQLALRCGATDAVNPADGDVVQQVRAITGTGGVDHSFEAIGLASTADQAVAVLDNGGGAYLIGMQAIGARLDVDPLLQLIKGSRSITGVYMGSTNFKLDIPMFADLYLQGRYNLDDLLSNIISLDEINEGYEELRGGAIARSVIAF